MTSGGAALSPRRRQVEGGARSAIHAGGRGTLLTAGAPVGTPPLRGERAYERRRPERGALYEVVRDNLDTLYGAIDDDAPGAKVAKHAREELEAFLDCGLLCRGFARLRCESCAETRLVAFSCKGRGFCPSAVSAGDARGREALLRYVLLSPLAWNR